MPITDAHDRQNARRAEPGKKKKVVIRPKRDAHDRQPALKPPPSAKLTPPKQDAHDRQQPVGSPRLRTVQTDAATRTWESIGRERQMRSRATAADRQTRAPQLRSRPSKGLFDRDYTPDLLDRVARGLGESAVDWMMRRANAPKRRGGIYSSQVGRLANDPRVRGVGAGAEAAFGLQLDPNTGRFIMGQDYDPAWAIAGLGFGVMGVGNPAHVSAACQWSTVP